jgi:hypothetical protein
MHIRWYPRTWASSMNSAIYLANLHRKFWTCSRPPYQKMGAHNFRLTWGTACRTMHVFQLTNNSNSSCADSIFFLFPGAQHTSQTTRLGLTAEENQPGTCRTQLRICTDAVMACSHLPSPDFVASWMQHYSPVVSLVSLASKRKEAEHWGETVLNTSISRQN